MGREGEEWEEEEEEAQEEEAREKEGKEKRRKKGISDFGGLLKSMLVHRVEYVMSSPPSVLLAPYSSL